MKKRIVTGVLCALFAVFCVMGCEKKSDAEKAADDAAAKLEEAGKDAANEAEKAADKLTK